MELWTPASSLDMDPLYNVVKKPIQYLRARWYGSPRDDVARVHAAAGPGPIRHERHVNHWSTPTPYPQRTDRNSRPSSDRHLSPSRAGPPRSSPSSSDSSVDDWHVAESDRSNSQSSNRVTSGPVLCSRPSAVVDRDDHGWSSSSEPDAWVPADEDAWQTETPGPAIPSHDTHSKEASSKPRHSARDASGARREERSGAQTHKRQQYQQPAASSPRLRPPPPTPSPPPAAGPHRHQQVVIYEAASFSVAPVVASGKKGDQNIPPAVAHAQTALSLQEGASLAQAKIAKPPGELGRRKRGCNMQQALQLSRSRYKHFRLAINDLVKFHFVAGVPFAKQSADRVEAYEKEVLRRFPMMDDYEERWPIRALAVAHLLFLQNKLKRQLESGGQGAVIDMQKSQGNDTGNIIQVLPDLNTK